jgi:hypothetical protein
MLRKGCVRKYLLNKVSFLVKLQRPHRKFLQGLFYYFLVFIKFMVVDHLA